MLKSITPVILAYNEEANIYRTLSAIQWAQDIVIVDSFSTDDTVAIASGFPAVRIFQRNFDTHAEQWNFAICETNIATEWVLALDADYFVTDEFVAELATLNSQRFHGYKAKFIYCVMGQPLRGTLYPGVPVLFRRHGAKYVQNGHTQRLEIPSPVQRLSARLMHDDRKPLSRWLEAQQNYARLEAQYLLATPKARLRVTDRVRLMAWPAPLLVFVYTLMFKGCIFDGWPGWFYILQRVLAEVIIATEILDRRLRLKLRA